MLNKSNGIPLYSQIQKIILARISSGDYVEEEKIDSEHQLCDQFGVGRPTVRQAISGLVEKGYLESFKGKGVFVKAQNTNLDLFSYMGTTEAFSRLDKSLDTSVLKQTISKPNDFFYIDVPKEQDYVELIRLRYIDKKPIIWERTFLLKTLVPGLEKLNLNDESLLQLLRNTYAISIGKIQQYFGVMPLTPFQQKKMKAKTSEPLLYLERDIECNDQHGVYLVQVFFKTDTYRMYQELQPPQIIKE